MKLVQIKTFYVVGKDVYQTQKKLQEQINDFIKVMSQVDNAVVGDIRIWSGANPLSLHGMIVYEVTV